jgi:hypothetical protein
MWNSGSYNLGDNSTYFSAGKQAGGYGVCGNHKSESVTVSACVAPSVSASIGKFNVS